MSKLLSNVFGTCCQLCLQKVTVEYVPQVGYLVAVNEHEVHLLDHILPSSTLAAPPTVTSSPPAQHPAPYVPQYTQQYTPQKQYHPTHNIPYMREDPYGGEEEFLAWAEPSGGSSWNRFGDTVEYTHPAYHHQVPFVEPEEPVQVRISIVLAY